MSDCTPDVINITKIKEGFHIGDELAGTNLDVIIQLKVTHMINAAGSQRINSWETIGIKYLTLNWSESPTQNLFDSKDEIANRIVVFIDESFAKGEGLLVHSVKGKNRVCIVVLIYLMKKYKWNTAKALDFLQSKKMDIEIPKYFLNQLALFEQRMMKKGEELNSLPWIEDKPKDLDEKLMVNTYLNGLPNKPFVRDCQVLRNKRHINWSDNNPYKKEALAFMNPMNDLFNQKDIKPITAHKKLHPMKSCMKKQVIAGTSAEECDREELMLSNTQQEKSQGKMSSTMSTHIFTTTSAAAVTNKYSNNSSNTLMNSFNPTKTQTPETKAQIISLTDINNNLSTTTGQLLAPNEYLINYSKDYDEKKANEIRTNNFMKNTPIQNQSSSQAQTQTQSQSKLTLTPTIMPIPHQISMTTPMQISMAFEKNNSILQSSSSSIVDTMKQQKTVMSNIALNTPQQQQTNYTNTNKDPNEKIIIMNKFEHIINNNINNIYIQSNNMNEMNQSLNNQSHNLSQTIAGGVNNNNQSNNPLFVNNFISTMKLSNSEKNINSNKEEFNNANNHNNSMIKQKDSFGNYNGNLINDLGNNNNNGRFNYAYSNKIPKPEMQQSQQQQIQQQQRIQKNEFLNTNQVQQQAMNNSFNDNSNEYKIIDYTNTNTNTNSNNNSNSNNNYNLMNQYSTNSNKTKGNNTNTNTKTNNNIINQQQLQLRKQQQQMQMQIQQQPQQQQQDSIGSFNAINFQQSKPLNNYNPTLNKKNSYSTGALFNRQIPKGPVKVNTNNINEVYNQKPSTPNQMTFVTYMTNKEKENSVNNYGIIHRSHSKAKDSPMAMTMQMNRPLTATHKDQSNYQFNQTSKITNTKPSNIPSSSSMNNQSVIKRLPSPQIHSNNMLTRGGQNSIQEKYRPPTPVMKSPNICVGSIKRSSGSRKY